MFLARNLLKFFHLFPSPHHRCLGYINLRKVIFVGGFWIFGSKRFVILERWLCDINHSSVKEKGAVGSGNERFPEDDIIKVPTIKLDVNHTHFLISFVRTGVNEILSLDNKWHSFQNDLDLWQLAYFL